MYRVRHKEPNLQNMGISVPFGTEIPMFTLGKRGWGFGILGIWFGTVAVWGAFEVGIEENKREREQE
jgi:hypothetical protein